MQISDYLRLMRINDSDFAKMCGVSQRAMNNYVRKLRTPTLEIAIAICKKSKHAITLKDLIVKKKKEN